MKHNTNWRRLAVGAAVAGGVGAALAYRSRKYSGVKLKKSVTVDRCRDLLYQFWRDFTNLPRFMDTLESVEVLDDQRSRWTVRGPAGTHASWDAKITIDRPNEMIGWQSMEGSTVDTAGYVRFEPAPGGRGTVVRVAMQYVPPAGKAGAAVATLLGKRPGAAVAESLRRFKQLMEAGEIATTSSKSTITRTYEVRKLDESLPAERVDEASEESFPASDPPAWTGTGV